MSSKGRCEKCGQVIQQTAFDKCMYCGAPLSKEQRFDEQEKQQILDKQQQALEEEKAAHQAAMKKGKKPASQSGWSELGSDFTGDGGGGDGG